MDKLLAPHTPEATAYNHLTYVLISLSKPFFCARRSVFSTPPESDAYVTLFVHPAKIVLPGTPTTLRSTNP